MAHLSQFNLGGSVTQRLYAHKETAKLMQAYSPSTCGKMVHPCDGEAWQQFNVDFPDFAREKRNVRLAVATDGFTPFNINAAPYSCWPVFVTPLNLPPGTLLRHEYIFLSLVIPSPEHPDKKLNILMLMNLKNCGRGSKFMMLQ